MDTQREHWQSRIGFILAAAGSAVGLGNIWKFPYLVGENGGASFIIVYLFCVAIIGLPVVIAEILIGRTAQKNPVGSFRELSNGSRFWSGIGFVGVIAGFLILSYYTVIAGWSLGYIVQSCTGCFEEMENVRESAMLFDGLSSMGWWCILFQGIFSAITILIIYFGVTKGIERASKIMMPLLLLLIIVMVIRGITLEGAKEGIDYLLKADFSNITTRTVLIALGQAFFSLSLGMGALLTYGSYMSKNENIPSSALSIVILDTVIAILAGFMIFPAVFAMGMQPDQGESLIFRILPIVFNTIPGGFVFRIVFFFLLSLAALTSTISLLEVITSFAVDELKLSRKKSAIIFGILVFLVGVPSALSTGILKDVEIFGLTFFGLADFIASNILLPFGGICISLFVGWFWGVKRALPHLREGAENFPDYLANIWSFIIRFIAPILIFIIFLVSLGVI